MVTVLLVAAICYSVVVTVAMVRAKLDRNDAQLKYKQLKEGVVLPPGRFTKLQDGWWDCKVKVGPGRYVHGRSSTPSAAYQKATANIHRFKVMDQKVRDNWGETTTVTE